MNLQKGSFGTKTFAASCQMFVEYQAEQGYFAENNQTVISRHGVRTGLIWVSRDFALIALQVGTNL